MQIIHTETVTILTNAGSCAPCDPLLWGCHPSTQTMKDKEWPMYSQQGTTYDQQVGVLDAGCVRHSILLWTRGEFLIFLGGGWGRVAPMAGLQGAQPPSSKQDSEALSSLRYYIVVVYPAVSPLPYMPFLLSGDPECEGVLRQNSNIYVYYRH